MILKSDIKKLSLKEKTYIECIGKRYFLMQPPERFVNHSCKPNTVAINKSDVAVLDIKKGEEITSSYKGQGMDNFHCLCGQKKCKKAI